MGASVSSQNFPDRVKEPGTGAAVLIADDDPAIRLVLRHRLEADGHRVEEAIDSATALAALRSNRFDVALLDIIMPGNGGLEVLSAAHSDAVRTLIIVRLGSTSPNVRVSKGSRAPGFMSVTSKIPLMKWVRKSMFFINWSLYCVTLCAIGT